MFRQSFKSAFHVPPADAHDVGVYGEHFIKLPFHVPPAAEHVLAVIQDPSDSIYPPFCTHCC
jgi:hypothetical protein